MQRLAWFTPLFPDKSGIAQYSEELLPSLASVYSIDVFVDGRPVVAFGDPAVRAFDAHDFVWRNQRDPYALVVYQLGNAPCHDYMWPYLVRHPGLVVLHDGQLHHARARALLHRKRVDDYRQEFWFNHPAANPEVAELGAEGLLGSLTYLWPMLRIVVETSRAVLVHNDWLAQQIRETHPEVRVETVPMGVPEPATRPEARELTRARYGIPSEAVLFLALGRVTPEKRIREAVRALAAIGQSAPDTHMLLAGETVDYYDALAVARTLNIASKVTVAGYVPREAVDDCLAAADVCLCMRWPTSRETSASWLRCLASGRPTVITDLVDTAELPMLDPRDWRELPGESGSLRPSGEAVEAGPVGVSIDILDEDHSLQLALRRLATDSNLRRRLGANAHILWSEKFRLEHMAEAYRAAIDRVAALRPPDTSTRAGLPKHLLDDGSEHMSQLLHASGMSQVLSRDLWSAK